MANTTGKKYGGRKKGTPNKMTKSVKDALLGAFDELGGKDYLIEVGREDPKTLCTLLAKIIPAEISAKLDGQATIMVVTGIDSPPGTDEPAEDN